MPDDPALQTYSDDQATFSGAANRLRDRIDRTRWTVLVLVIAAAFLETLGSQLGPEGKWAAWAGAVALAVAGVGRQFGLGREQLQAWGLARSASEALKRELFLYRVKAEPYDSGNPDDLMLERREAILRKATPVLRHASRKTGPALGPLDEKGYLEKRIQHQSKYFNDRADRYDRRLTLIRTVEVLLAIAGAVLGVVSTTGGKQSFGVWVAVLTTISGALAAHAQAQRYEQLVVSFRATALRLLGIETRWSGKGALLQMAKQTEAVLAEENQTWMAGIDDLLKQAPPEPPAGGPGPIPKPSEP